MTIQARSGAGDVSISASTYMSTHVSPHISTHTCLFAHLPELVAVTIYAITIYAITIKSYNYTGPELVVMDMCVDVHIGTCTAMSTDVYADTCIEMHADMVEGKHASEGYIHAHICPHMPTQVSTNMFAHACTCLHMPAHACTCLHMSAHV